VMDRAIGRVIAHLKATGQFERTVIFFLSDNGACAEWDPYGFNGSSGPNNNLLIGDELKRYGSPPSYISYGSGWAHACNTPWRLFKHYMQEGGVRTPFIAHWPAGLRAHGMVEDVGYITDLMPTICALTGATYPSQRNGTPVLPQEGVSLLPVLTGGHLAARRLCIEHEGNRSVRDGDWKLVAIHDQPWELYDLAKDPTEMHDLAAQQAPRVADLAATWEAWAVRCGVKSKHTGKEEKE
jgi:arylsulfatase A-like enzyme